MLTSMILLQVGDATFTSCEASEIRPLHLVVVGRGAEMEGDMVLEWVGCGWVELKAGTFLLILILAGSFVGSVECIELILRDLKKLDQEVVACFFESFG